MGSKMPFEKRVTKHILDGFFTQIMINAVQLIFVKVVEQVFIELFGTFQIRSKWFFNYQSFIAILQVHSAQLQLNFEE